MEKVKARVIKASRSLQQKAGSGDIPPGVIARAEKVVEENAEDFAPLAKQFLERLSSGIEKAYAECEKTENQRKLVLGLTKPVMDLKANARMFKYELITNLANIMLDFLESLEKLDKTAIDIVAAHAKTLNLIITKRMSGSGGEIGKVLEKEWRGAVQRYTAQKKG